jgi:biopolymer transport protein ExbD
MAFEPSRASRSRLAQPMADINTTPLVDVMLVLLVVFLVTAPVLHRAVPVDLPRVDAAPVDARRAPIRVSIDAQGSLSVDGEPVEVRALDGRLRTLASGADPDLHLHADRAVRHERVVEVMAAARRAGLSRIGFVTEPAAGRTSGASSAANGAGLTDVMDRPARSR